MYQIVYWGYEPHYHESQTSYIVYVNRDEAVQVQQTIEYEYGAACSVRMVDMHKRA